ncbi:MAG: hypothetical protein DHS20C01_12930 [marine bacterium B5-7]|nr:MAG: hypothetical protein DHS20C01_12930 [marine bacterium B5-7]
MITPSFRSLFPAVATVAGILFLGGCVATAKQAPPPATAAATPAPVVLVGDADGDGVPDDQDACPGTRPGATVDHKGCEVIERLDSAQFEYDSAALTPSALTVVDRVAARIMSVGNRKFEVAGHTDSKGTDEYNDKLGQRRAIAVYEALTRSGVPANQLVIRSYGETQPIAPNANADGSDNPEGRALNRRVEIVELAM